MLACRPVAKQSVKGSILHELQHYGQDADNRPAGGSPQDFESKFPGPANEAVRKALYRSIAGENEPRRPAELWPKVSEGIGKVAYRGGA